MPLMVAVMARSNAGLGAELEVGGAGVGGSFAAEKLDLEERQGVDVRVAQADGMLEDGVGFEQGLLLGDGEDHAAGEVELVFEEGEDAGAEGFVFHERGVKAGDAEVGFAEGHFDVAEDVDEEGEGAEDLA